MDTTESARNADVDQSPNETAVQGATPTAHVAHTSRYSTGMGLFVILSGLCFGGGLLVPPLRKPLVALGCASLFGAILLYVVTPERFLAADVVRSIESATSRNLTSLVGRVDVAPTPRYVPTDSGVKLFFPDLATDPTPPPAELSGDPGQGLVLEPVGCELVSEMVFPTDEIPADTFDAMELLSPFLTDQLGLAERMAVESHDAEHVTVRVTGNVFDTDEPLDHPIQSVLSVGLALAVGKPVQPTLTAVEEGEFLITFRWGEDPEPA